jgi:TP901 family phage tail tape measure protein
MTKVLVYEVEIKGVKTAVNSQEDLAKAIRDTTKARQAEKFNTDEYKRLGNQIAALKTIQQEQRQEERNAINQFKQNADQGKNSYRALNAELVRLRNSYKDLTAEERQGAFGQRTITRIKELDRELKSIDANLGNFQRNVGNYSNSFNKLGDALTGGLVTGGIVAVAALAKQGLQELFELNKAIADIQANVVKTTGLSFDQVTSLTEELKKLDTRTTLVELLNISTVAGRLGVEGEKGVFEFTKAIDVLNVALGDDFGGNVEVVTDQVGKLSNVLFGATTDGELLAENLLSLGNGLNVLAANGAASANGITDFSTRIAALGIPLGLTAGEILGISASLEELGVTAERGGTATGRIFQALTQDSKKFAKEFGITPKVLKDAGIEAKSFTDLVNTDLVKALQLASSRAVTLSKDNVDLSSKLKAVGLTGAGELETFLKLGQANERLSQNIGVANKALEGQQSLLDEAAAKNENLAGAYERLINDIREFFVSSDVQDFFLALIQGARDAGTSIQELGKTIAPLGESIGNLAKGLTGASKESDGLTAAFDLLNKAGKLAQKPFEFLVATVNGLIKGFTFLGNKVNDFYNVILGPLDRTEKKTKASAESLKVFTDLANKGKGDVLQFGAGTEQAAKGLDKLASSADKAKKIVESFAKDSLSFLRGEVSRLEKEIDQASPKDQPALFERLFSAKNQLGKAEKEQKALLDNLTGFVEAVKEVQDVSEKTFQRTQTVTEDGVIKQVQVSEKGLKVVGESLLNRLADLGKEIGEGVQQFTTRTRTDLEVSLDALLEEFGNLFTSGRFFDTLTEAGAAISGLASARNESELNAIEERYAKEIELAGDNTKKKEKLEKELAAEQERIRKKEFEQQKRFRIASALSSLASGVVNILATPSTIPDPFGTLYKAAQIAFLTFTTTSQIAQISAQKAAKGMIIKGPSHAHGGTPVQVGNTTIEAEGGEWIGDDGQGGTAIVNKHNTGRYYPILKQLSAVNFPGKRVVLSAINADRGYGVKFEQGGLLEPNFSKMNVGVSGGISIVTIDANSIQNMAAAVGVGAKRGVEAGLVVANRENERIAQAEQKSKI